MKPTPALLLSLLLLGSLAQAQSADMVEGGPADAGGGAAQAEAIQGHPPEPGVDRASFDALAAEVRRLKEEVALPAPSYESHAGLGPAASKVYFTKSGLSIGGYGEAFYTYRPAPDQISTTDILRVVLYTGYRFSDRIVFNSEIEFEHGATNKGGVVGVEFAYLDFKLSEALSLRAGNVLVPMGFVNEVHEPPFYYGVRRPVLESDLIPATWNENGIGVYGEMGSLRYRGYLLNGFKATGKPGFSSEKWLRDGRQGGAVALAKHVAGVASVEYLMGSVRVGASGYYGYSGQGAVVNGTPVTGAVLLAEGHAALQYRGFSARAIAAYGTLSDAAIITAAQGSTIGSSVAGGYGEAAFDVLTLIAPGSDVVLSPFARFEVFDLNNTVEGDAPKNGNAFKRVLTVGIHFKPLSNVVAKADFQRIWTGSGSATSLLSVGAGFVF